MAKKFYEILDHTADIRIRVRAIGLKTLFSKTARAMFDIIAEKKTASVAGKKAVKIIQRGKNLEDLFINWLNELLSLSSAYGLVFSSFKIKNLGKNSLEAFVLGERIKNYQINKEIKAATYHQLQIVKDGDSWKAEVIFDV